MKKFYLLFFIASLMQNYVFSNGIYGNLSPLKQITNDNDSSTTSDFHNVITIAPLQLFINELRVSYERQVNENKYNIYGLSLMYFKALNSFSFPFLNFIIRSDRYWGINLFYGKKTFYTHYFYCSYLGFVKYEHDSNLELGNWVYDRYYSDISIDYTKKISYRNKYVLGAKLLFGFQSNTNKRLVYNFFWGVGVRTKLFDYSETIDKNKLPYITKGFIFPSFHLGFTIGYRTR